MAPFAPPTAFYITPLPRTPNPTPQPFPPPTHFLTPGIVLEPGYGYNKQLLAGGWAGILGYTVKKIRKFTTIHWKICFRLAVVNLQQNVVSFSTSP